MNITVDTNVLVRLMVGDDQRQAAAAERSVKRASRAVITLSTWCEYVWVLRAVYGISSEQLVAGIELLCAAENVVTDRSAIEAGLLTLRAGGDFADGAMAHEGRRSGGEVFVSFDRKAVRLITAQGYKTELL